MAGRRLMRFSIITLFPAMFDKVFDVSIIGRARRNGLIAVELFDLRDFSRDKHRTVDDHPFGGGGGMIIKPEPVFAAVEAVRQRHGDGRVILLSPAGRVLRQPQVRQLGRWRHLIMICGHYEGVDERVAEFLADECLSVGDYVLSGGELPAMVVVDAVSRQIAGVLGNSSGADNDSFADGLLEYPQYTRPAEFRGWVVPEVLLSGHHRRIAEWRREQAETRTRTRRPDLWAASHSYRPE
ncbi:MAG: tRNA (guanosine(37)-N1)-methyltransferase TrmD [Negativicutes bacterium]|nr:tRNA (guanosine(37)-N1)-methyltransferase TrmD [Negativicutes bacterium]